jgi:hypothetical protein
VTAAVAVERPPRVPWEHVGLRDARAIRGCVRLNVELYSAVARYAKARNHSFSGELRRLLWEAIEARQQTEKLVDRLFR